MHAVISTVIMLESGVIVVLIFFFLSSFYKFSSIHINYFYNKIKTLQVILVFFFYANSPNMKVGC